MHHLKRRQVLLLGEQVSVTLLLYEQNHLYFQSYNKEESKSQTSTKAVFIVNFHPTQMSILISRLTLHDLGTQRPAYSLIRTPSARSA